MELTDEYLSSFDINVANIFFTSKNTEIDTTYGKEMTFNSGVSVEQSIPSVNGSTKMAISRWYPSVSLQVNNSNSTKYS